MENEPFDPFIKPEEKVTTTTISSFLNNVTNVISGFTRKIKGYSLFSFYNIKTHTTNMLALVGRKGERATLSSLHESTPVKPSYHLSFIPQELLLGDQEVGVFGLKEKFALAGVILGSLSVVSWVVIIIGLLSSVLGIIFSYLGFNSSRQKFAKIGLILSILGLTLTLWYIFAAYEGRVNYVYFTGEFWEVTLGLEK